MKIGKNTQILATSFLLTAAFLFHFLLNAGNILALPGNHDTFFSIFVINHYMTNITSSSWENLATLPMLYGTQNSLFLSDHFLSQALLALPFYIVTRNIILTYSLLVFATFFLSFFSMSQLAYHFTKQIIPSILAAVIFVFNPFNMGHFPGLILLFSLQWLPLIFLFFEKSLKKPGSKNTFLFFVFLSAQLLSSLYYSAFLTIILPIYAAFRLKQEKINPFKLINFGFISGLLIFLAVTLSSTFLYMSNLQSSANRNLGETEALYSAWISDYLTTGPRNLIYGNLKENLAKTLPQTVHFVFDWEHYLFMGITPAFILLTSFKFLKKTYQKIWFLFLALLIFSVILSFGPGIHLTREFIIYSPLYLILYYLDPLLSYIRVASRLGIFVFFFLALISSLTLKVLLAKFPGKKALLWGLIFISLTILEYWNKPLDYTLIPQEKKGFYEKINQDKKIQVILDLPIGNNLPPQYPLSRIEDLDANYLLLASILHNKKLFNGFVSFMPEDHYKKAEMLSINFPTKSKLETLKNWGVDAIILHKEEFKDEHYYYQIKERLIALGITPEAETENLTLFKL